MNMSLALRVIAAVMFACAANAQLHAQSCTGKGPRTDWFQRGVVKGPDPVSAADRAVIETRLAQFENLVRQTAFGSPRGFEAYPSWHYAAPLDRTRLSWYAFDLVWQCPSVKATGGDGQLGVEIIVNPDPQMRSESDRPHLDANGDAIYDRLVMNDVHTQPFNFSGNPTLSVPRGLSVEGLPLSLQFVGWRLSEAVLCRAGHAFERATEWHFRRPAR